MNITVTTKIRPFVLGQAYEVLTTVDTGIKEEIYSVRDIIPEQLVLTNTLEWLLRNHAKQLQDGIYNRQIDIFNEQINGVE
jgi:hypothetical protein